MHTTANVTRAMGPPCGLSLLRSEWSYFGLRLRIGKRTEFGGHATRDCGHLASGLEACEIRPISPGQRPAQPHTCFKSSVVNDVNRPLVVGCALPVAAKIAEISAGREDCCHSGNLCDLIGVLQSLERFDHQDQHNVVVDRVAISAGYVTPHCCLKGLAAAVTASAKRREVGPVPCFDRFFDRVYGRHHDHESTSVQRMLNLPLVGVSYAHARNSFCCRACTPHTRDGSPVMLIVLHLSPDEVVSRVSHRAICGRICGTEQRAPGNLATLHHLELHRIPNLRSLRSIECRPVRPGSPIERSLLHCARRGEAMRIAVLARGRGEREVRRAWSGIVERRIGRGRRWWRRGWPLKSKRDEAHSDRENRQREQLPHN